MSDDVWIIANVALASAAIGCLSFYIEHRWPGWRADVCMMLAPSLLALCGYPLAALGCLVGLLIMRLYRIIQRER
jgi:hypothetical protein